MDMSNLIKRFLFYFFNFLGFSLSKTTSRDAVVALLKRIRPKKCNVGLVRIGNVDGDGGYLAPNDLTGIDACFSPGVATESNFEKYFADRNIKCFMADYSVDVPVIENINFHFEKIFIGARTENNYISMDDWVNKYYRVGNSAILQMDIEGAEYDALLATSDEILQRFRVIILEVHFFNIVLDRYGYKLIDLLFTKILRSFEVIHVHPNNSVGAVKVKGLTIPPVLEYTFLRKDRVDGLSECDTFPHPLDRDNSNRHPTVVLPKCFYG
jgi:hypothetical protein